MHENLNREEEVKVSSDQSFGIVFALVFLAVGVWVVSGGQSKGWFFFVSAALFLVVAIARPSILGPLNRAWAKFGLLLGRVINPVILGVVFFVVVPHKPSRAFLEMCVLFLVRDDYRIYARRSDLPLLIIWGRGIFLIQNKGGAYGINKKNERQILCKS